MAKRTSSANKLQTAIVREIEEALRNGIYINVADDHDADVMAVKRKGNVLTFNVKEYSFDSNFPDGTKRVKHEFKLVLTAVK